MCLYGHHLISSATSHHFHFKLKPTSAVSFPPPSCWFVFPLCSKVSRWDKVNPREIQQYLFHHFIFLSFFVHLSFCLSLCYKKSAENDSNSRKTSAVCLLFKELSMTISPADEHLLFLFCSLVNLLISLILQFLCPSASQPFFQSVVRLVSSWFFFFLTLTSLLLRRLYLSIISSFIYWKILLLKVSFFTCVFSFPLCSKISRWARVT